MISCSQLYYIYFVETQSCKKILSMSISFAARRRLGLRKTRGEAACRPKERKGKKGREANTGGEAETKRSKRSPGERGGAEGRWALAQGAPAGARSGRLLRPRRASRVPASSQPSCAGLSEIEARVQRAGLAVVVPVRAMHHGELGLPGAGELQAGCVGGRGRRGRGSGRTGWAELARGRRGGPVVRRGPKLASLSLSILCSNPDSDSLLTLKEMLRFLSFIYFHDSSSETLKTL